ncbi:C-signal-like [Oratosquilla oratoria]|uniref:C-signal-like n=1 Tax=Oratosquilla oratoria TaxID=337810 RepID=UPI003F76F099
MTTNVVIQGASRGIGLQFCRHLIQKGTNVIACCRAPSQAEDLQKLKSEYENQVDIVKLDVTSESDIQEAAKYVSKCHGGKLDLLINSSGILHPSGRGETSLKDVSFKGLEDTLRVNTLGPLMMAKYFGPLLMAGGGTIGKKSSDPRKAHAGILVNMSARVASIGDNRLGGWYSYRVSKTALNMVTRNLSIELGRGRKKVICVALHPGTVDTSLSRPYHKNVPAGQLFSVEQSVSYLMGIIDGLSSAETGRYYGWDGKEIPF